MADASLQGAGNQVDSLAARPDEILESDEGVDVTLIRWMLALSPSQRLEVLQNAVDSLTELRDAAIRA